MCALARLQHSSRGEGTRTACGRDIDTGKHTALTLYSYWKYVNTTRTRHKHGSAAFNKGYVVHDRAVRGWTRRGCERVGGALRRESRSGDGAAEGRGGGAAKGGRGRHSALGRLGVGVSASRRHRSRRRRLWRHCCRRHVDTFASETPPPPPPLSAPSASSASGGKGGLETGAAPTKDQTEQVGGGATAGGDDA